MNYNTPWEVEAEVALDVANSPEMEISPFPVVLVCTKFT